MRFIIHCKVTTALTGHQGLGTLRLKQTSVDQTLSLLVPLQKREKSLATGDSSYSMSQDPEREFVASQAFKAA